MPHEPWTVILAAGAGRRLAQVTGGVPKQFWRAEGGSSLLKQTLDRFVPLAPHSRTVIVVNTEHLPHVAASDVTGPVPWLMIQPQDRGTAAGVLLALTPVLERAPESVVVITPSDHGVLDDVMFRNRILEAVREARRRDEIVLFGVEPTQPHTDYGWISLGPSPSGRGLRSLTAFVEKPVLDTAAHLFASGAVWNTMVIVGRARALWDLYVRHLPALANRFAGVIERRAAGRADVLASLYRALPTYDFSRDLLTQTRGLSASVWPATVGWSDLGTPERLREWQRSLKAHVSSAAAISAA
jgi:mannose-1-phosphate guanylyltransferase